MPSCGQSGNRYTSQPLKRGVGPRVARCGERATQGLDSEKMYRAVISKGHAGTGRRAAQRPDLRTSRIPREIVPQQFRRVRAALTMATCSTLLSPHLQFYYVGQPAGAARANPTPWPPSPLWQIAVTGEAGIPAVILALCRFQKSVRKLSPCGLAAQLPPQRQFVQFEGLSHAGFCGFRSRGPRRRGCFRCGPQHKNGGLISVLLS